MLNRRALALQMHENGRTYANIACALNVSPSRARQIVDKAKRTKSILPGYWGDGLPTRVRNVLDNHNIVCREQAIAAVREGTLLPGHSRWYGKKSERDLCQWLGIEVPQRGYFCPHCGGRLKAPSPSTKD